MMRFGCQTYTWQMTYQVYKHRFSDILDVIAGTGFKGVEAEICMLGAYYEDPALLSEAIESRGLELAALTLAEPWLAGKESAAEREQADRLIRYLQHFPGAKLITVQLPGTDRRELDARQQSAIACVNAIGERAAEAGICCAYHPNSPAGSVFRTASDYEVLFRGLDERYVGYCPDSGHIARGGMDVLEVIRRHRNRIVHVHFKDYDENTREWRTMGQGTLPHSEAVSLLRDTGYEGWIMVEEESAYAKAEPEAATRQNAEYLELCFTEFAKG
ncbi:hypothetical protein BK126_22320 [Paenibacillus sp. FSL H7-0326]|uniref:sugar phosphate isomerase/epimerase family protein n=1 Tax=Paenibacillus sp. FSL H7-0326 TaxID=1921144 RepID=UPI00096C3F8F|nr:sugar phosphate isomerase/epimerase [Paenibacillus sp. FSL H7-0326]OMC65439.1 hypothetical protein BK126_22320 [Paenibacillus sp. FSL H7-0326]